MSPLLRTRSLLKLLNCCATRNPSRDPFISGKPYLSLPFITTQELQEGITFQKELSELCLYDLTICPFAVSCHLHHAYIGKYYSKLLIWPRHACPTILPGPDGSLPFMSECSHLIRIKAMRGDEEFSSGIFAGVFFCDLYSKQKVTFHISRHKSTLFRGADSHKYDIFYFIDIVIWVAND